MKVLEVTNVTKQFGDYLAVNDVSFNTDEGTLFGLLGPNGAGKTTLIRMITNILMPDKGEVKLNGEIVNQEIVSKIGYMPEERGLYKKMKVGEQLKYLARLRGLTSANATEAINYWLQKFDIANWHSKKIEELSKGMAQKIQFISTVIHNPKVIILDEPFSGLDPVNTNLIKDEIFELKQKGASIIFSTHRMEQVEEICEEILLISKGQKVLEGKVDQIKHDFKKNIFNIKTNQSLTSNELYSVKGINAAGIQVQIAENATINKVLQSMLANNIELQGFEEVLPSINEIFIEIVGGSDE